MYIKDIRENPYRIKYGMLAPGAVFEFDNGIFMVTNHDPEGNEQYWAVCLRTGELEEFDSHEGVILLEAELTIKHFQEL